MYTAGHSSKSLQISEPIPIKMHRGYGPKIPTIPISEAQLADLRRRMPAPSDVRSPPITPAPTRNIRQQGKTTFRPTPHSPCNDSRNTRSPYDLDLVEKFYDSFDTDQDIHQPPPPTTPRKTRSLEQVQVELPEHLRCPTYPSLPRQTQPVRKAYFLHSNDFYLRDFSVEFIHRKRSTNRLYPAGVTINDPCAQAALQQQADIIMGLHRQSAHDYRHLAQVLTHSEWSGYEYTPLTQISRTRRRIRFEYIKTAAGREYWSLPVDLSTPEIIPGEPATYDSRLIPRTISGSQVIIRPPSASTTPFMMEDPSTAGAHCLSSQIERFPPPPIELMEGLDSQSSTASHMS